MINKLINWLQQFKEQTIFAAAIFFTFVIAAILTGVAATAIDSGLISLTVFVGVFFGLRWTLNRFIINPTLELKKKNAEAEAVKTKNLEEEKATTASQEGSTTIKTGKPFKATTVSGAADIPKPLHKMSEQQKKINKNRNIRKRRNENK